MAGFLLPGARAGHLNIGRSRYENFNSRVFGMTI